MGPDSHYFQRRDYNMEDLDSMGLMTCKFATDLTSKRMFTVKVNVGNNDTAIKLIQNEASLLSKLENHHNILEPYGFILEEQESEFGPLKVYKLMMELCER